MVNESVFGVLNEWESTGEMTPKMAEMVEQEFDKLMEVKLSEVEASVDKQPQQAFADLAHLTFFLSMGLIKRPSMIGKLGNLVQKFKAVTNSVAKKLGANGFSIGVGYPFGVSIDLSFPIT